MARHGGIDSKLLPKNRQNANELLKISAISLVSHSLVLSLDAICSLMFAFLIDRLYPKSLRIIRTSGCGASRSIRLLLRLRTCGSFCKRQKCTTLKDKTSNSVLQFTSRHTLPIYFLFGSILQLLQTSRSKIFTSEALVTLIEYIKSL